MTDMLPPPPPTIDADRSEYQSGELPRDVQADLLRSIVADTVDKVPSRLERLQAMPTPLRVACAFGSMTLISASTLLPGVRPDLRDITQVHFIGILAVLLGAAAWGTALALRGTYRRPLGAWAGRLALVALLLPIVLVAIPDGWPGTSTPSQIMDIETIACGLSGLAGAVVAALVLIVYMRDQPIRRWRLAAASGGAGLMGMMFRGVHCPYNDFIHMFFAHALLGVTTAGLVITGATMIQRIQKRSSER
jgi:hypothetical protein